MAQMNNSQSSVVVGFSQNLLAQSGSLVQDVRVSDHSVGIGTNQYSQTAEHHVLYQYSLVNAQDHFMGLIQTETVRHQFSQTRCNSNDQK